MMNTHDATTKARIMNMAHVMCKHNLNANETDLAEVMLQKLTGIFSEKNIYSTNKNCMFLGMPIKGKVYGCIRENKVFLNT